MRILLAAVVRFVVIGVGLAAYYAALPLLFPDDGGGANIGAGLLAFAALMMISIVWATYDGRARGFAPPLAIWTIVAAVVSVGWLIVLSISQADASMSAGELISSDLDTVPFTAGLILAPAIVGAAVGHALRPARIPA